jgi:hypothetical protein
MSRKKLFLFLIIVLFTAGLVIDYFILHREKITYSSHIAQIIYEKCTPCHRAGEVGIFPLTTYHDAERRAKMLAKVTSEKTMPPWPADYSYVHYAGERYLTEEEIKMISDWAVLRLVTAQKFLLYRNSPAAHSLANRIWS